MSSTLPSFNLKKQFFSKLFTAFSLLILLSTLANAQSYKTHYIAPAPWQYWSAANELVVSTNTVGTTVTVTKSDGTAITTLTPTPGNPAVYRFVGDPFSLPRHALNTVLTGAGLIVSANNAISVNLRNVASDDLTVAGDPFIKGNASLFSFGDAAIGTAFRVGYYRDGDLNNGGVPSTTRPVYTVMALADGTTVKLNGTAITTLNKGQSYALQTAMGGLVETSGSAVMNTGINIDVPEGCGDGAYNPVPPVSSYGSEYVVVRGKGNNTAEQTTVVASEPNTNVTVYNFSSAGVLQSANTYNLVAAGSFITFPNGIPGAGTITQTGDPFSGSRIVSDKNVVAYAGTANDCEVDIATLAPITSCGGALKAETSKFRAYANTDLPYFAYIITKSPTEKVYLTTTGGSPSYNNVDIETISGVGIRRQLGSSGSYVIDFNNVNIGTPTSYFVSSDSRLTVAMVQSGLEFSMSNFLSPLPEQALIPTTAQTNCATATLSADPSSLPPFQWYLNGVIIPGATGSSYIAPVSGSYTVTSKLDCGNSAQSIPVTIALCNVDLIVNKTVNDPTPAFNSTVNFTITATNSNIANGTVSGTGNAIGVSVTDLLPAGYTYVSSTPAPGTSYDPITGLWSIGAMSSGQTLTLVISAKVNVTGSYTNTATITGPQVDPFTNNNTAASTPTPIGVVLTGGSNAQTLCFGFNNRIADIEYTLGVNTSNSVTGLPNGVTWSYDPGTNKITISGEPLEPTIGNQVFTYTVTSTNGATSVSTIGTISIYGLLDYPTFSNGVASARCQGAGTTTYSATSLYGTSMTYSLSPVQAGVINPTTGVVTWSINFNGNAIVSATTTSIGCGYTLTTDHTVTVVSTGTIAGSTPVCSGSDGTLTLSGNPTSVDHWEASTDNGLTWSTIANTTTTYNYTNITLTTIFRAMITNAGCTNAYSSTATITVTPRPVVAAQTYTFCQTGSFTFEPVDVPNGTTYTWSLPVISGGTITGESAGTNTANVSQTLTNTGTTLVTVTYTVTPTYAGCSGNPFTITVTLVPVLTGSAANSTSCSGTAFNVNPLTNVPGTTYTWTAALQSGTATGFSNQSTALSAPISQTLTNTTTADAVVTYTVTPHYGTCAGASYTFNVTVSPAVVASASTQSICSANAFSVTPTSNLAATTYTWTATLKSGTATGFSDQTTGLSSISQTLVNNTSSLATVTYTVTPIANGCPGASFTFDVNVNPAATLAQGGGANSQTICEGTAITPITYTWGGGATDVSVANLPTGLVANKTGNVLTISGTPTSNGTFTVSTTGQDALCTAVVGSGTITMTVISAPVASNQTFCEIATPTIANLVATGTAVKWYAAPAGGTALATNTPLANGIYYASQTIGGCESLSRTAVTVTITVTAAPTGSATQSFCDISNAKVSNLSATGTGIKWYNVGGTLLLPTETLTNGTVYYASQTLNGCESVNRFAVTVIINVSPKGFNDNVASLTCANSTFSYNLQTDNVNSTANGGNSVPATFTWNVANNSNVIGEADGTGSVINQTLINTSNTLQFVVYTVTPTAIGTGSCAGNTFTVTVSVPVCSSVNISKSSPTVSVNAAGNVISYAITVTNTGNANQTNVAIADPLLGTLTGPIFTSGNTNSILEKNEIWTYTGSYTVLLSDLNNNGNPVNNSGIIRNTATFTSNELSSQSAIKDVAITLSPSLSLVKSGVLSTDKNTITYTFTVQNTGNVTLTGINVTDVKVPGITLASTTLLPGASTTGTSVYTISQSEKDAGIVNNTATAIGTPPTGANVTDVSGTTAGNDTQTSIIVPATPSITLVKSGVLSADKNTITYTFTVQNTGNVTLTGVNVTDVKIPGITLASTTLIPGASTTGIAVYTITQSEKDAGVVNNTATATGTPPTGANVTDVSGTTASNNTQTTVIVPSAAAVTLIKTGVLSANGNTISYSFIVKNTGNVTINNLTISDSKIINPIVLSATTLAPGAIATATVTYTVTDAEKLNGSVTNTATVTGKNLADGNVTDISGSTETNDLPTVISTGVYPLDDEGTVNAFTGGDAIANALDNDKLNGNQATLANVTITQVSTTNANVNIDPATGKVTVLPNTLVGIYFVVYQIQDKANPTNFKTATVKVNVVSGAVIANDDNGSSNTVTGGVAITNVLDNDKYNTTLAATTAEVIIKEVNGSNTSAGKITLNTTTGSVTVAPNTPAGVYTIDYTITDKLDPTKIDPARITITISSGAIQANNDAGAANGFTGGTAVLDVLNNDTYNGGTAATLANVNLTQVSTTNPNVTLDIATGKVNVLPNTPAGIYNVVYQIVDKLDPSKTQQATAVITVTAPVMVATDDNGAINGVTGGVAIADILSNDTYNGSQATLANVTITQISSTSPKVTIDPATGKVNVAPGTPEAVYTLKYRITDKLNPTLFKEAFIFVTVSAAPMIASDDSGNVNGLTGGIAVTNVLNNDTYNGSQATLANVTLKQISTSNPKVTLNTTTGEVNVAPNTPAGVYTLVYEIEDILNPGKTKQATVTVTVGAPALAASNDSGAVNGFNGGVAVSNVLVNDTYNGSTATLANVNLTQISTSNAKVTLNLTTGAVNVAPNTPAGNYTLVYQIEDKLNPGLTKQATVFVTVTAPSLVAVNDSGSVSGLFGGVAADVLANDDYNGSTATLTNVTITQISSTSANVTLDPATGKVNVAANTPNGTYTLVYQIEDKLNPGLTKQATVTVLVVSGTITALPDAGTTNGFTGGIALANVLDNDIYNGNIAATLATVTINQLSTSNPNVNVNVATGQVVVAAGTLPGIYTINYQITDKLNPTQKSTTTVTVTIPDWATDIAVTKTANKTGVEVNEAISYTITITNNGPATVLAGKVIGLVESLPSGLGSVTYVANGGTYNSTNNTFTTTSAIASGQSVSLIVNGVINSNYALSTITNQAAISPAIGTTDADASNNTATITTPILRAKIALVKVGGLSTDGNTINYTFTITNTGDVALNTITLTDAKLGLNVILPGTLAVGASTTYNRAYTLTQNDKDLGTVTNTANASAKSPAGNTVTDISGTNATNDVPTVVTVPSLPSYTFTKAVDGTIPTTTGGVLNYKLVITNTGNVTLSNITVLDANATITGSPITSLLPGANATITATHILTQAEIDAGNVVNQANATARDPKGINVNKVSDDPTTTATNDATVAIIPSLPAFTLNKIANNTGTKVGDVINYTLVVKNTGNVTLTNILITDLNATVTGSPIISLSPNATVNITAIHILTQADVNAGTVSNQASAVAKDPKGNSVNKISNDPSTTVADDPTIITIIASPSYTFKKVANNTGTKAGDVINYTLTVTNTGNVTLSNIVIADPKATVTGSPVTSLNPGATASVTATHILTQAEVDAGTLINQATATAKDPKGNNVVKISDDPATTANDDPTVITIVASPSMTLTKAANNTGVKAGDVLNYTLIVKNTGNVTLSNVVVTDAGADAGSITPANIPTILPGAIAVLTAKHTLTQAEINAGTFSNQASATAKDPKNNTVADPKSDDPNTAAPDDPTVVTLMPNADLVTVKRLKNTAQVSYIPGDDVVYRIDIKNNGPSAAINVKVEDIAPLGTTINSWTATANGLTLASTSGTGNLQQTIALFPSGADVTFEVTVRTSNGSTTPTTSGLPLSNTVKVTSGTPDNSSAGDVLTTPTIPADIRNDLSITKTSDKLIPIGTDTPYDYTITVKNNGFFSSNNVVVTDVLPAGLTYLSHTAASGSAVYSTSNNTLTWTVAKLDAGAVMILNIKVQSTKAGIISNTATVKSNEIDPNLANNTAIDLKEIFALNTKPNVITPNGDGKNDTFVIDGLQLYPENYLYIFNRWGNEVYHSNGGYKNDWGGNGLKEGTYYYLLKVKDTKGNWTMSKGYITLLRNN